MSISIDCFKAYDVRGRIPDQLNVDVAYRIGNALVQYLGAKTVVIGRDIRLSSEELAEAVTRGITDAGAEVLDFGIGGTEMVYFATSYLSADAGVMVTASHNPADYNGIKFVREESRPISGDSGLEDIRALAENDQRLIADTPGEYTDRRHHAGLYRQAAELRRRRGTEAPQDRGQRRQRWCRADAGRDRAVVAAGVREDIQ